MPVAYHILNIMKSKFLSFKHQGVICRVVLDSELGVPMSKVRQAWIQCLQSGFVL